MDLALNNLQWLICHQTKLPGSIFTLFKGVRRGGLFFNIISLVIRTLLPKLLPCLDCIGQKICQSQTMSSDGLFGSPSYMAYQKFSASDLVEGHKDTNSKKAVIPSIYIEMYIWMGERVLFGTLQSNLLKATIRNVKHLFIICFIRNKCRCFEHKICLSNFFHHPDRDYHQQLLSSVRSQAPARSSCNITIYYTFNLE